MNENAVPDANAIAEGFHRVGHGMFTYPPRSRDSLCAK